MNQVQFQLKLKEKEITLQISLELKAKGPASSKGGNLLTEDLDLMQDEVTGMLCNRITWDNER